MRSSTAATAPSPLATPATPTAAGGAARRATRTPTVLRAAAAVIGALAVAGALATAVTTVGRTAAVDRLAGSTAAVTTAVGDADAAFAQADAAAAALATPGADDATELRYLQGLATGVNELEHAAQRTRLGEPAEAPIRRALRSVQAYAADVARAQDAAAAGRVDQAAVARAGATMTNLIRGNTAQVGAVQDDAVRRDTKALRDGRAATLALVGLPLAALLAVLVLAQVLVARRFRRLVNLALAVATVIGLGVTVRTVQLQTRQTDRVAAAVSGPYGATQALTDARVLAYRVEGQRIAAGLPGGAAPDPALQASLQTAVAQAAASTAGGPALTTAFARYESAVASSTGDVNDDTPGKPTSLFKAFDAQLLGARTAATDGFAAAITDAQQGQSTNAWLAPVLLALTAGLAWLGLQRRLAEYR